MIRGTEPGVGGRFAEAPPSGGHGGHSHLQVSRLSSGVTIRRGLQTPGSKREPLGCARPRPGCSGRRLPVALQVGRGEPKPERGGRVPLWAGGWRRPRGGRPAGRLGPLPTPWAGSPCVTPSHTGPRGRLHQRLLHRGGHRPRQGRGAGPHGRGLRTGAPQPKFSPHASSHIVSGPQPGGHLSSKSQNRSPRQVNPSGDIG